MKKPVPMWLIRRVVSTLGLSEAFAKPDQVFTTLWAECDLSAEETVNLTWSSIIIAVFSL